MGEENNIKGKYIAEDGKEFFMYYQYARHQHRIRMARQIKEMEYDFRKIISGYETYPEETNMFESGKWFKLTYPSQLNTLLEFITEEKFLGDRSYYHFCMEDKEIEVVGDLRALQTKIIKNGPVTVALHIVKRSPKGSKFILLDLDILSNNVEFIKSKIEEDK